MAVFGVFITVITVNIPQVLDECDKNYDNTEVHGVFTILGIARPGYFRQGFLMSSGILRKHQVIDAIHAVICNRALHGEW
jgi:hypothetical protein